MRVYEFSQKSGIPNKDIIKLLKENGFDIQSHMSMLDAESLNFLKKKLSKDHGKYVAPEKTKKEKSVKEKKSLEVEELKIEKEPKVVAKKEIEVQEEVKVEEVKQAEPKEKIENKEKLEQKVELEKPKKVIIVKPMMLSELAEQVDKSSTELILTLIKQGLSYNKNQVLPDTLVEQLIKQFGFETAKEEKKVLPQEVIKVGKELKKRLPVVVVIGHVDHGKTTLLDFIRKTRVASKEKGGITQHLGAYQVETAHGGIIFLDTPGHEAFSMMRGRGIRVADIAILVVAADDGVMPQTVEAIKLAQSKNIPIIVALNKIDKADSIRIEQVKSQLSKQGLMSEDWGGQTIFVPISAKLGLGIDQLLEMIILQSEVMDLVADESISACGYVLESKYEKGLGPVATFIPQHGIIKVGDFFICGNTYGKINVLVNSNNVRIESAGPSIPVQISGFEELPKVGDFLQVVSAQEYRRVKSSSGDRKNSMALRVIPKESINIILKTDNDSSKEALLNSINQFSKKDEKELYIVFSGVGNINENDVILASNVNAVIYGFGVKTETNVLPIAQKNSVSIRQFDIIYNLIDDIKELIKSKQEIKVKLVKTGEAVVRKVFDIKGVGVIAGFYVKDGKIVKNGRVSVLRGSKDIGKGEIKTLQREKKSMKEIAAGFEGALLIENFKDWAIDDRIECFVSVPIE